MDDHVEYVSTMYLPRNSPIYWPIKVTFNGISNNKNVNCNPQFYNVKLVYWVPNQ